MDPLRCVDGVGAGSASVLVLAPGACSGGSPFVSGVSRTCVCGVFLLPSVCWLLPSTGMYQNWLHTPAPTKQAADGKPHVLTIRVSRAGEADPIVAQAWIDGQVMFDAVDVGKDRSWPRTGSFGIGHMDLTVVRVHSVRMWATTPVAEPVPEPVVPVGGAGGCCVIQ